MYIILSPVYITMSYVMLNNCITHIRHRLINTIQRSNCHLSCILPSTLSHRDYNTHIVSSAVIRLTSLLLYISPHIIINTALALALIYRGISMLITLMYILYHYICQIFYSLPEDHIDTLTQ